MNETANPLGTAVLQGNILPDLPETTYSFIESHDPVS